MARGGFDLGETADLAQTLREAQLLYPKRLAQAAMDTAAGPVLTVARVSAPVGKVGKTGSGTRISLKQGRRAMARGTNPNDYRRGGATQQDLRKKPISRPGYFVMTAVGVSKKAGKVGWRTHFLTMGTRKMRKRDFLTPTRNATASRVIESFGSDYQRRVKFYLEGKRYRRP